MLIDFRTMFPKYGIAPKGVLHIGSNIGEEAPIYDQLGIQNALFIEAHPETYQKLKDHLEVFYRKGREYIAENYCVGDEEGKEVMFHVSNNASQSSSILELGTHKTMHPNVNYVSHIPMQTTRMDTHLMDNHGFDFLNIDLQGAELLALKGLGKFLYDFKWVYLEVNSDHVYEGCALLPEIEAYLAQFGFHKAELKWASANLTWGDCLFLR